MCGILGEVSFKNNLTNSKKFKDITDLMKSRGPDDKGYWNLKNKINFGFRRLSIIDLNKRSNQPFVSKKSGNVIIFNGEIYNYKNLKMEISSKDNIFETKSDTEVILKLYEEEGVKAFKKLRGMFAFAIWDNVKKKLILYRDLYGIKPLYFFYSREYFCFSSSLKTLLKFPYIKKNYDKNAILSFNLTGSVPEPMTIIEDIKIIEPGTLFEIDLKTHKIKKTRLESILKIYNLNKRIESKSLKECLDETIKAHLVADVQTGLFLSSGIDSTLISKIIKPKTLKAFTISFNNFKDTQDDEIKLSKKFCKDEKINLTVKYYKNEEILKILPNFFNKMEQPTVDGLNNFLVCKLLRKKKIKIALSGTGADEILCGYNTFLRAKIIFWLLFIFPKYFIKLSSHIFKFLMMRKIYKTLIFLSSKQIFDIYFFLRSNKEYFYKSEFQNMKKISSLISRNLGNYKFLNFNEKISYFELMLYQKNQLLRDLDWTGMSNSIEMRVPFIDKIFLKQIKSNGILAKIPKKRIIKKYLNLLPDYILNRKKTGFSVPYNEILEKFNLKYNKSYTRWSELSLNEYLKTMEKI